MVDSKRWMIFLGLLLLGIFIYSISAVLTPFLIAATLAYLTNSWVLLLNRCHINRTLAVVLVFIFLFGLFILSLMVLIPALEAQIQNFVTALPSIVERSKTILLPWLQTHLNLDLDLDLSSGTQAVQTVLQQHWQQAGHYVPSLLKIFAGSGLALLGFLTSFLLVPVVLFYLLRDWDKLLLAIHALIPRKAEPVVVRLFKECDAVLSGFLRGQLMVMIALGLLYSFGLAIAQIGWALLIGVIGGLLSIVPYLGFTVGILTALIAAFFQYHDWTHIMYVLIVFVLAQSIEGSLLTPYFVGDRIHLHPVAVIFAVLAGGSLFGFLGILLALPVAAVVMVFVRYIRDRYVNSTLYNSTQTPGV